MKSINFLKKAWTGVIEFIAMHQIPIMIILIIIVTAFPFLTTNKYFLRISTLCLINIVLGLALNLVQGYMGQMSFATVAFFGIGAYAGALSVMRLGLPSLAAMVFGMVTAAGFGFLIALPTLKLKGYYLSIVTMGFCEIIRIVEMNWQELTRGSLGIMNIPSVTIFGNKLKSGRANYIIALIILVIVTILIKNLVNSNFGLSLKSIRDDDSAAETMGINIVHIKRVNFIISAAICGFVGAFYAQYVTFIHPSSFTSAVSQEYIVMIIFGGLGSIPGTFLGCIILTVLPELMRGLLQYRLLIYGALMVIMMNFMPGGLLGNLDLKLIRKKILDRRKKTERKGGGGE
ncbi:branched-chain amino acid ABC transporter permease [Lacrimispora sp. NSJ-141]|uniref:Branched-chain amino acid ABC transporter permease n=1 Tax=Lientehia hominis TaxID=2897778 RepID=A0AAP2WAH5_9FIRM|nr:branched-chain amino acid ABC transporter permease [Lientehia hominis]MCD2493224.1 branched-chain amino acid ABC transporter permease [Lientehia hominis]